MKSSFKLKAAKMLAMAACMALAAAPGPAVNADKAAHVTRFELISHGMNVGHGRIVRTPTRRDGKPCMELRMVIESKVRMLLFKYDLKMDEAWVSDASGLIAYKLDSTEDGRHKTISGELRDGIFNFEIIEDGQKRVWTTPRADFDLAAISNPGQMLAAGEEQKSLVLDPATCAITENIYRGAGAETLTVGQRRIQCQTITIESPGAHIRRWFIMDEFGPLILREEGRQKRGTYSRRAISMDLEPAGAE